jgi:ABC-type glycerol-3-phosphate transport system permease component
MSAPTVESRSQAVVRPRGARAVLLAAVIAVVVLFALPLLWMFTSSLRPGNGLFDHLSPLSVRSILPIGGSLTNYAALTEGSFGRAILNSLFVSGMTVVLGLVVCTLAAFALSALRFRGQNLLFSFFVLTFLIPFDAIAVPLAALFQDWQLTNSYLGLILPGIGNGFAIFLLRQFFLGIPRELTEAARVDGLGWFGILVRIFLPLSRPVLIGAGMMLFLSQWQAYVWPLLIGTEPAKQLGPIALANLRGEFTVNYGVLMAGSVVLTVIPLLLMLRFQRHFTQSLASTGLKE